MVGVWVVEFWVCKLNDWVECGVIWVFFWFGCIVFKEVFFGLVCWFFEGWGVGIVGGKGWSCWFLVGWELKISVLDFSILLVDGRGCELIIKWFLDLGVVLVFWIVEGFLGIGVI